MTKVYVGYLYQIDPGAKKIHNCYSSYGGFNPIEVPSGYVLFQKIPFRKNVVKEVITGKKIHVIAEGNTSFFGVHTFLKFDGTMYQKAKIATKLQIENYINSYNSKEDYVNMMNNIFTIGEANAQRKHKFRAEKRREDKKQYSELVKQMKAGSYEKKSSPNETVLSDKNSNLEKQSNNSSVATDKNQKFLPNEQVRSDNFTNKSIQKSTTLENDKSNIDAKSNVDIMNDDNRNQLLEPILKKDEIEVELNGTDIKNLENDRNILLDTENVVKKNETINDVSVNLKPDAEIMNDMKTYDYSLSDKKQQVLSTFGRENTAIIKELAEIAGKGGEAIATIEGVEVSTKYLVDEKDLTEYFLAKRYNRTPESLTVRAVLANEESMNIVNKNRSL